MCNMKLGTPPFCFLYCILYINLYSSCGQFRRERHDDHKSRGGPPRTELLLGRRPAPTPARYLASTQTRLPSKVHREDKNPTILCSNARRCRVTAWIVLLWFPEIWFRGHLRYFRTLNISQNAGERVSELRIRKIMRLLWKQPGDVVLITHHQLANTKPLRRFASERSAHLTAVERDTDKVSPGGACLLDLEAKKLSLMCGRWVQKR